MLSPVLACMCQELANGGEADENMLGDYSPFAVAEFRDWLRHTGIYDAVSGACKVCHKCARILQEAQNHFCMPHLHVQMQRC